MQFYGKGCGDMREKKNFFGRIGDYLNIPEGVLPGDFSVLLSGDRVLCVQGKLRISAYSEERIVLCVGKHELCVEGKGLFCAELAAEKILINGTVTALYLKKGDKNAT